MSKWKKVSIPEVVWYQEGPGVRNTQYTTTGVKLINVANLQEGNIDLTTSQRYISKEEAYGKYKHFLIDIGDFIVASSGIKVDYFDKKMGFVNEKHLPLCMNTSTIRFKPHNTQTISMRYFMYYLKSDDFKNQLERQIVGSAQLNFGPSHLKKMHIPLPPLDEQKKIANKLDKITDIITKRKAQLEKLDLLVKSRFIEMFGDIPKSEYVSMNEVCSIITDGTHQPPKFISDGIPFIFVSNLANNEVTYNVEKYITDETYNELIKRTPIEVGDILLSTVGSYGHPAVVKNDKRFLFQRHIAYLKPKKVQVDSIYLYSFLLSADGQQQIKDRVKGIAQKTLNLSEIKKLMLPLPTMDTQTQFATFVTQVDKSKFEIQKGLEKLEILKKALMQQYFG